jgi:hypothetical protein
MLSLQFHTKKFSNLHFSFHFDMMCPFQFLILMMTVRITKISIFFVIFTDNTTSTPLGLSEKKRFRFRFRGVLLSFPFGFGEKIKNQNRECSQLVREESNKLSQIQPENMNRTFQSISNIAICYYAPVAQILILHTKT